MIKGREPVLAKANILIQVFISIGCFWLAEWGVTAYKKPVEMDIREYKLVYLLIAIIWYSLLDQFGLGRMGRTKKYSTFLVEYITLVTFGMGFLFAGVVMADLKSISRLVLLAFSIVNLILLFGFKLFSYRIIKLLRGKGYNTRSVLIIADKYSYYHFIDEMIAIKDWGYRIWAIMTNSKYLELKYGSNITVLPDNPSELPKIIDANVIDEVIYCKGKFNQDEVKNLIYTCSEVGVVFRVHSELLNIVSMRSHLIYFNQLPFLTFFNQPNNYLALQVKNLFDFVLSLLILILASPVILLIVITIKLEDGGPVFFKQKRVGLNGRYFYCLKFRTMVANAEALQSRLLAKNEQSGPVFKIRNDPRVTGVGRFLRKTSLDELPQFINVLWGEMSIVGPRPPIPSEVSQYKRWQRRRLSMKPGITCIWQVSGRNNIPFEEWMKLDMLYIDTWSLKLDLILFLSTIKVVLTGNGQ